MTSPALSVPDLSSNGRTMITPGNHQISCWPEKPGVMADAPLQLLAKRTHGVVTLCALRIQLGRPSFEVDSACGADGHTPLRNFDIPHAPSLVTAGPNLTRPLQSAVGARLQSVPGQASLRPNLGLPLRQCLRCMGRRLHPPLGAQTRRPLEQQYKVVLFPRPTARLPQFAASPQHPHHPRSTTSRATGWKNAPSFRACVTKLELWANCNPWPLPWDSNTPELNRY